MATPNILHFRHILIWIFSFYFNKLNDFLCCIFRSSDPSGTHVGLQQPLSIWWGSWLFASIRFNTFKSMDYCGHSKYFTISTYFDLNIFFLFQQIELLFILYLQVLRSLGGHTWGYNYHFPYGEVLGYLLQFVSISLVICISISLIVPENIFDLFVTN